jgi:hypothetical protein
MGSLSVPMLQPIVDDASIQILRIERRLQRERAARLEAEAIAEKGLRELYEQQQQLALLETISTASNQSVSVEDTLALAVAEICRFTEWPLGQIHMVVRDGDGLRLNPMPPRRAADTDLLDAFIGATQATSFQPGKGLPGRVMSSASPVWIPQLANDKNFPRVDAAARCGLQSAIGFPILVGHDVAAVAEFFSYRVEKPNAARLALLAQIGVQLGRVI